MAAPERILVHLDRVQVRVRVAALSLRKDKDDEGNKKKQKNCPREGCTPNKIDLIARAPVIVPNRQVWDRLWHLRVQVNFSDSRCIMGWCLFGVIWYMIYSSSKRQTYRLQSLGFGSEPLPRAINPDVERLHPEQSNYKEKKSLICRKRKSKRQSHLWFHLVPWPSARYLFKTALLVAAWWWDWSIVNWDVLKNWVSQIMIKKIEGPLVDNKRK